MVILHTYHVYEALVNYYFLHTKTFQYLHTDTTGSLFEVVPISVCMKPSLSLSLALTQSSAPMHTHTLSSLIPDDEEEHGDGREGLAERGRGGGGEKDATENVFSLRRP